MTCFVAAAICRNISRHSSEPCTLPEVTPPWQLENKIVVHLENELLSIIADHIVHQEKGKLNKWTDRAKYPANQENYLRQRWLAAEQMVSYFFFSQESQHWYRKKNSSLNFLCCEWIENSLIELIFENSHFFFEIQFNPRALLEWHYFLSICHLLMDGPKSANSGAHKMNVTQSPSKTFSTSITLLFCTETPGPRCQKEGSSKAIWATGEDMPPLLMNWRQYFVLVWITKLIGLFNRTYPRRSRQDLSAICCLRWHRRFLHFLP